MASQQAPRRYITCLVAIKDKYRGGKNTLSLVQTVNMFLFYMHPSFKSLIVLYHRLSRVNYAYVNDLVASTFGLTYYFHHRVFISKMHGNIQLSIC